MPPKKTKKQIQRQQRSNQSDRPALGDAAEMSGSLDDLETAAAATILTGEFMHDFLQLCKAHGLDYIPPVVNRRHPDSWVCPSDLQGLGMQEPKRSTPIARKITRTMPKVPSARTSISSLRGWEGAADNLQAASGLLHTVSSVACTLFNIAKNSAHYFKPRVQVEYVKWERQVKEVYVQGWKVDMTMMTILCECLVILEKLVLFRLWNVALTAQTVDKLASSLPRFQRLTSLVLDANNLADAELSLLVEDRCKLEHLSLRFCQLSDVNAHGIGRTLGTAKTWNKKLLSLNLSNNKITDVGARHLAGGLTTNRTLLVLNLASNQIGDEGTAALAQALSDFPLNDEQMAERREKISEKAQQLAVEQDFAPKSPNLTRRMSNRSPPVSPRKKKSLTGLLTHQDVRPKESTISPLRRKKETKPPPVTVKAPQKPIPVNVRPQYSAEKTPKPSSEETHPLLEVVTRQEGERIWLVGNRSLLSLNLSRNVIGEKGLRLLSDMLQEQAVRCKGQQQTTQGLKRLVLHRNAVSEDNTVLKKIQHYMLLRDPTHHIPLLTLHRDNVAPCAMPPITI